MTEQEKIEKAVDEFATAMKEKLFEKANEGFTGWDTMYIRQLKTMLGEHVIAQLVYGDEEIDIANYCMFLRYRKMENKAENEPDEFKGV
ncbi:MAG: hypothetical protein U9Q97_08365 [Acidobacteriota bacterium]|nr:hypothetical protein [Acidobacteriota bacterium]